MGQIVAIGGGDNGWGTSKYETGVADECIISLTKKEHPVFLFIGFAAKVPEDYFEVMCGIYRKYNCIFYYLDDEACKSGKAKKMICEADIIYVGGGNTYRLMCKIRRYGLDILLSETFHMYPSKVFCGVSAGAIIWSAFGNSATRYRDGQCIPICVKGIGLLDVLFCPHVSRDTFRAITTKKMLERTPGRIGLEIDYAAIVITGDQYCILALDERAIACKCYWSRRRYFFRQLKTGITMPIEDLYSLDGKEIK